MTPNIMDRDEEGRNYVCIKGRGIGRGEGMGER